jgi:1,4-dihydroxy-2-naphthoyl-CoA hydrolase
MMANIFDTANISIDALNKRCENTMSTAIGLVFTEITADALKAKMMVNASNCQPLRMLNGGASMAVVEILGSMAANLILDRDKEVALGQSITGNHFRPVKEGEWIEAFAIPIHIGRKSQVWEVSLYQSEGKLVCKGTMNMAVIAIN